MGRMPHDRRGCAGIMSLQKASAGLAIWGGRVRRSSATETVHPEQLGTADQPQRANLALRRALEIHDCSRSHREAQRALKVQKSAGARSRATCFQDLVVYQILSEVADTGSMDNFVRRWLGLLLDYDTRKGSPLWPR